MSLEAIIKDAEAANAASKLIYSKIANAIHHRMAHPTGMAHLAKTPPLLTTTNNVRTN